MIEVFDREQLTPELIQKAEEVVSACVQYEGLTLSMPDLDSQDEKIYLYFGSAAGKKLLAFLAAYDNGGYFEVTAFTLPEYRRKGIFTKLFRKFIADAGEETPLCFYTDGYSYDAFAALEFGLGAEYASTEHLMELDLSSLSDGGISVPSGWQTSGSVTLEDSRDIRLLSRIHSRAFEVGQKDSEEYLKQALDGGSVLWKISAGGKPCGLCIGSAGDEEVYLYSFAIDPDFQGRNIGTSALRLLLRSLKNDWSRAKIQVSEENSAAYALYRSAGFKTVQELQEYWY